MCTLDWWKVSFNVILFFNVFIRKFLSKYTCFEAVARTTLKMNFGLTCPDHVYFSLISLSHTNYTQLGTLDF